MMIVWTEGLSESLIRRMANNAKPPKQGEITMNRYDCHDGESGLDVADKGELVYYEEHMMVVRELQSRLESLEKDAAQMHDEIINLRVNEDSAGALYTNWREAYLWGHRDARHAAAELVAAMQANKGE